MISHCFHYLMRLQSAKWTEKGTNHCLHKKKKLYSYQRIRRKIISIMGDKDKVA